MCAEYEENNPSRHFLVKSRSRKDRRKNYVVSYKKFKS